MKWLFVLALLAVGIFNSVNQSEAGIFGRRGSSSCANGQCGIAAPQFVAAPTPPQAPTKTPKAPVRDSEPIAAPKAATVTATASVQVADARPRIGSRIVHRFENRPRLFPIFRR